ncbi:MAG: hypothetical protein OXU69_11575 [Gemmatimonadota bacterium]|nr:hypothetical protein [Gemmatimonadota bacterium]MDE2985334.1 hypothetical protein [Gemmatimonadota bacterium]
MRALPWATVPHRARDFHSGRGPVLSVLSGPAPAALAWCALALVSSAPLLRAQDRERERTWSGPPILALITSTRAMGLGGAFWTGGNADHAVFHHPALISGQGFDLSLAGIYTRDGDGDRDRDPDDAIHLTLSAGGTWLGGNVAVGLAVFDYGVDIDVERERGRGDGGGSRAVAAGAASWGATEFVGTVGYSRNLFGFGVGAAGKVIGWTAGGARARTAAVDVGVSRTLWQLRMGLTVQNLGPDLEIRGRDVPLSRRVVLGAGTQRRVPVGPLDIGGAVQVAREYGGDIVPGGGVEVAYWPVVRRVFIARIGVVRVLEGAGAPLTFGAGFEGDRVRLDYGYRDRGPMTGPHQIGISIR